MKVRDLMTSDVVTLREDDTAASASTLMEERHVRHLPVVNEDRELAGLVTQRDLLRGVLGAANELPLSARSDLLRHVRIREIMTVEPETIGPDDPLREAGALLLDNKFGCLPVVEGSELVGILTEADFVRFVTENES